MHIERNNGQSALTIKGFLSLLPYSRTTFYGEVRKGRILLAHCIGRSHDLSSPMQVFVRPGGHRCDAILSLRSEANVV